MDFDALMDKPSPLKRDLDDLGISWDDLALHVGTALRGRPATVIEVGTPRPLTEEEILLGAELRAQQRVPTSAPPEILRLRSRHHLIAQLLSAGFKPTEVALKTGYSISRVSILQADPMFRELLENYKSQQENLEFDVRERLRLISLEAIDELQQRFDEKPSEFDNKELFTLAELALDRTGLGKSAVVTHQYGLDPETAALIKAQRPAARTANLLEGVRLDERAGDNQRSVPDNPQSIEYTSPDRTQLELFDTFKNAQSEIDAITGLPPESQAPRRAYESAIPPETPTDDTGGAAQPGSEVGTSLPAAVYGPGGQTGTVVQFRSPRSGAGPGQSVDEVP